jgi:hypothetical protein
MKRSLLLFVMAITLSCCKNDDDNNTNPIDLLPPATQTGEQTFGCLINGEPFVPPSFGTNAPNAFYQFVDGAYTLGISAGSGGGSELLGINIGALDVNEIQEINYILLEKESGKYFGQYTIGGGLILNKTSNIDYPGTLTITNFDEANFIISGTFSFTVIDNEGNEINITDGRFDMHYTN